MSDICFCCHGSAVFVQFPTAILHFQQVFDATQHQDALLTDLSDKLPTLSCSAALQMVLTGIAVEASETTDILTVVWQLLSRTELYTIHVQMPWLARPGILLVPGQCLWLFSKACVCHREGEKIREEAAAKVVQAYWLAHAARKAVKDAALEQAAEDAASQQAAQEVQVQQQRSVTVVCVKVGGLRACWLVDLLICCLLGSTQDLITTHWQGNKLSLKNHAMVLTRAKSVRPHIVHPSTQRAFVSMSKPGAPLPRVTSCLCSLSGLTV